MLTFVILCTAATVLARPEAQLDLNQAKGYFEGFTQKYGRTYSGDEKLKRFEIFKQSLRRINQQNLENPLAEFVINQFSDLTPEEFRNQYTGYRRVENADDACVNVTAPNDTPPASWDWRDHKAVTPVKDQGFCGSCWAFSTVGNLEGQYAIKHGKLESFSEKQLVDCNNKTNCKFGGDMIKDGFLYIKQIGGIMKQEDYPYKAKQETCRFEKTKVVAQVTGCELYQVKLKEEEKVKNVLHTRGPLTIGLAADDVKHYGGGIITKCDGELNHGVVLVGYGTENNTDYWLFKNSWGFWGENGYFRVKRGINGCGFMSYIASAIVA